MNHNQDIQQAGVGQLRPEQIVVTVVMTRVSEYFGFFVFAIGCALVFPQVMFPNYDPITGTMISFGVFSLAFLFNGLARIIFAPLEERVGRGARITVAMFLLGGSSIFVAFIPSYADVGIIAPLLLVAARIGQGLGAGGASDGLPILMMMNAPENKKSWYAMMPQLGGPIGFAIAASIYYVLTSELTPEEFIGWGWRYPFLVVLSLQVVALFARLRLIDTPEYKNAVDHHNLQASPAVQVLKNHWPQVLLGTYLPLASYTFFHLITIFPLGYIKLYPSVSAPDLLLMLTLGSVLAIVTCVLSGPLADRFVRRRFLIVVTVLVGVFSFFIADWLNNLGVFVFVAFALLGLSFGQSGGTLPHRFERQYRYTGVGISTDLGWFFGAAFAPLFALGLTIEFGIEFAGYYLLSGVVATLIALVVSQRMGSYAD